MAASRLRETRTTGREGRRIGVVLFAMTLQAGAAPPLHSPSLDITPAAIARDLQRVERQSGLPQAVREQIGAKYKEALEASRQAAFYAAEKVRHEQLDKQFAHDLHSARTELLSVDSQAPQSPTKPKTTSRLREDLATAQANLRALREALSDSEGLERLRAQRRTDIANRIAAANLLIRSDEMQASSGPTGDLSMERAIYIAAAAHRKVIQNEVESLRAELASYDNNAELPALRRELAERRVAMAYRIVQNLEAALLMRTAVDSEALRKRIHRECEEAVRLFPPLRPVADEVLEYVQLLAAPGGVQMEADLAQQRIAVAKTDLAHLRRILQTTKRKFLAAGIHRDASQWFPEIPASMPTIAALKNDLREREIRIAEIEHEIASLENTRTKQGDIENESGTLVSRLTISAGAAKDNFESQARQLLYTRRDLQGGLLSAYSHTLSRLLELDLLSRSLLAEEEQLAHYVRERILWVKSVPDPIVPVWSDLRSAAIWLVNEPQWSATVANAKEEVATNPVGPVGVIVVIGVLLALRPRFARGLVRMGQYANGESFAPTQKAVLFTLLLALPLPASVYVIGRLIMTGGQTRAAVDMGAALLDVSVLALAIGFSIAMARKGGLAEQHLHWPEETTRPIRSVLRWILPAFLFASCIHLAFGRDVTQYIGPREQVAAANSLGRLAFVLAITCAFIGSWILLRPRGAVADGMKEHHPTPTSQWFRSILLPLFISFQLLVAILAVGGYYLTASILMRRAVITVSTVGLVLLLGALANQWRSAKRRVLTAPHQQGPGEREIRRERDPETEALALQIEDDQLRRLSQFVGSALTLVLIFSIWSDLLPSLQILDRITLLPTPGIITDKELATGKASAARDREPQSKAEGPSNSTQAPASAAPKLASASISQPPPSPALKAAVADSSGEDTSYISLADLLIAILLIVVTILLAKDIPGPLQFLLRRPLPNAGDRNAVATIVKYIIVLIGLSAAARQFGLKWSQIQWLAAAFSFGIAFGLQEIFANFVSGIIILVERPMAVGDICRFGSEVGTVEAIGLRSTRVRAADRTVIIVPNAAFSKKEVVNYAKRDRMLIQTTLHLRLETTEEQVRTVVNGIHEVLLKHPKILPEPRRVRFGGFGSYSLNIEIFAYADCRLAEEFLQIQEALFFEMMEIIRGAGTDLAIPSQPHLAHAAGGETR